jgi:hypothetical protein
VREAINPVISRPPYPTRHDRGHGPPRVRDERGLEFAKLRSAQERKITRTSRLAMVRGISR